MGALGGAHTLSSPFLLGPPLGIMEMMSSPAELRSSGPGDAALEEAMLAGQGMGRWGGRASQPSSL